MTLTSARIAVAAIALALADGASPATAADKLQVATSGGGTTAAAAAIAFQLGYFKDAGLDVVLFDAGGGNNAVSTVVGGDAQVGIVGIRNASKPVEKGQPLKLIGTETKGFNQYIVVRRDLIDKSGVKPASSLIERGAVLRGLKIGVNDIGGSSGEFARYVLAAAGFGGRDATIINLNSAGARLTALKGNRIDAIIASPPEPETAFAGGYGATLVDPLKDLPEIGRLTSTVHIVRDDYLRQNAAVVKKYLQAVERSRGVIKTDPEAAEKAFYAFLARESRGAELPSDVADLAWRNTLPAFSDTLATSREQYANAQKFFRIPAAVTYEQFIDNSVVDSLTAGR